MAKPSEQSLFPPMWAGRCQQKMAWCKLSRNLLPRKPRHHDLQDQTSAISKSWQIRYRLGQSQPSSIGHRPASPSCTPVLMEQPEHWFLLVPWASEEYQFQPQMSVLGTQDSAERLMELVGLMTLASVSLPTDFNRIGSTACASRQQLKLLIRPKLRITA